MLAPQLTGGRSARRMAADRTDFTIAMRRLCSYGSHDGARNDAVRDMFLDGEAFDAWALRYAARLRAEGSDDAHRAAAMRQVNPKLVLRDHPAEGAIRKAREGGLAAVRRLHRVLQRPVDEPSEHQADSALPPDWAQHLEVSCSS